MLAVFMVNVDYLIVGRLLGSVELGLYLLAFNLSSWPVSMFSVSIARVSVAGFARLAGDPPALAAAFVRSTGLLMALGCPSARGSRHWPARSSASSTGRAGRPRPRR